MKSDGDYRNGTAIVPDASFKHCPLSPQTGGQHEWIAFRLGRTCRVCMMTLSNREWNAVTGDELPEPKVFPEDLGLR